MKFPTLQNGHCISKKICLEQLSAKCRMQSTLHWGLVAQRCTKSSITNNHISKGGLKYNEQFSAQYLPTSELSLMAPRQLSILAE